jgi:ABC-type bacteriocin/lantibiotic exporter with double-glycine peptidase domain
MIAAPDSENGVIQFENVGLRYGLGPEILRDLSFKITPHSFQFLSGPSGAGKTSLLRLLFLSLRPTRGLITLFDHDTATLSKDSRCCAAASASCSRISACSITSPRSTMSPCR